VVTFGALAAVVVASTMMAKQVIALIIPLPRNSSRLEVTTHKSTDGDDTPIVLGSAARPLSRLVFLSCGGGPGATALAEWGYESTRN
jgi:hypothetical protein